MSHTPEDRDDSDDFEDEPEDDDPEDPDYNPDNYEDYMEAQRQDREREAEYRQSLRAEDPVYQRACEDFREAGIPVIEGEPIEDVGLDAVAPPTPKRQYRAYRPRPSSQGQCARWAHWG